MKKIWVDLDNTPHIPFFKPIIDELSSQGYGFVITAREAFQVVELAERFGLKYEKIGHHYGKNKILKIVGLLVRSLELIAGIKGQKPALAISHGSRSQLVAAYLLGIPTIMIYDYEYSKGLRFISPTYFMVPEVIPDSVIRDQMDRVFKYPGIKEDVYVPGFIPDPSIKADLGIDDQALIVTVRPPATEAHYFTHLSEELFESAMSFLLRKPETQLIILPRNKRQEDFIRKTWADWLKREKIIIPDHAVNGLDLMWFSDLVISGGGTMNREAAALGVPVYSIFRGKIGAVDRYLSESGRLVLLESPDDFQKKIVLCKRDKSRTLDYSGNSTLRFIVDKIVEILNKSN